MKGVVIGVADPALDFRVHGASISKQKADVQEALSQMTATTHCREFMKLEGAVAVRAYRVIHGVNLENPLREWIWFIRKCLPRMRLQSFEMWVWVACRRRQISVNSLRVCCKNIR